jgi:hypothetical protein
MGTPSEEKALYVGEAGNCLTDGTPLIPGETICVVGAGEAHGSDLWQPIKDGEPASSLPRNSPPSATPPAADAPDEAA